MSASTLSTITSAEQVHIGAELQITRKAANLTLNEVAAQLHIQASYLDAIERMDKDPLPSLGYAVGYVRTYARFLGMDEAYAILKFKTQIDAPKYLGSSHCPHHVPKRQFRLPKGSAAIGSLLACVLVVGTWYGMQSDAKSAPVQTVVAKPMIADKPVFNVTTNENWGFKPMQPTKNDPEMLSLKAIGPSWVHVVAKDGTVLISRVMVPGEIFETNRKTVPSLSLRDAGAIELYIGGERIGLIGQHGASAKDINLASIAAQ